MRTISVAVAALALLGTAASAQTTSPRGMAMPPSATQAPGHREPAINPLTQEDVSKIEGTTVYGDDDKGIGHVSEVLMNPETKKIERLVVSAGGVLGVGGHRVAIPIDQFTWDSERAVLKLPQTLASLKSMPAWVDGATATGSSQAPKNIIPPAGAGGDRTD